MEVPGVIMTLCCNENKCVRWWRLREHKGNELNNQKCTGWEFVLLTKQHYGESLQKGTMWSCSTWQLHTDTSYICYTVSSPAFPFSDPISISQPWHWPQLLQASEWCCVSNQSTALLHFFNPPSPLNLGVFMLLSIVGYNMLTLDFPLADQWAVAHQQSCDQRTWLSVSSNDTWQSSLIDGHS